MFFWPWMIFRTFSLRCWFLSGWKWMKKKNRFLLQQTVERLQVNTFHLKIGHSMPIENIVRAFWGVLLSSQGETCGSWTSEIPSARIPLIYQGCAEDQGAVQVVYIYIYIEPSNYITYPKDRRYSATIFVPHLLCVWFSERRFKKNHIEDGGFHKLNGGTPKWMVYNGKSC